MIPDTRVTPNAHIYVDGTKRRIIRFDKAVHGLAIVCDIPGYPGVPTHSYALTSGAIATLHSGGTVRTCGHLFSLREPVVKSTPVQRVEVKQPPPPPTFRQRVARVLHRFADTIGGKS